MPFYANVRGFMQVAGYDPMGGTSPLALPQKSRGPYNEYANAERLLGFVVDERLTDIYADGQTTSVADNPTLADVQQAATEYLTNTLPGTSQWQATMVSRSHYGTPEGWTPIGTGTPNGFLFEIRESTDGGTTWGPVRELAGTHDKEFGGNAYIQPVLSLWWG